MSAESRYDETPNAASVDSARVGVLRTYSDMSGYDMRSCLERWPHFESLGQVGSNSVSFKVRKGELISLLDSEQALRICSSMLPMSAASFTLAPMTCVRPRSSEALMLGVELMARRWAASIVVGDFV